ncbi:MAG: endonuclease NucS [Gammaproteobacteria bacterium]|nr:endonuclease NucS [Gammaproteobacteria bacterium]
MTLEAKLWRVDADRLEQLKPSRLDEEKRLEDWLCRDTGLLSDKLLVIGRQISMSGGTLDLLAVDEEANLVIVELKRAKTPRDVVAQTLDYASCVQDFGREDVERHTRDFLEMEFDKAFLQRFGHDAPETVNERHRMLIVASSLDSATQRIVEYLSRVHGVDINAATFSYFNTAQGEFLARSTLLDEDEVERRVEAKATKRRPVASEEALRGVAVENGVGELWDTATRRFSRIARKSRSQTTLSFNKRLAEGNRAVLTLFPSVSSAERGLAVTVVFDHLSRGFGVDESRVRQACGTAVETTFDGSYSTADNNYYLREKELEALLALLDDESGQETGR